MSKYTAEYWKDRADEIRAIRDNMTSEVPRRITTEIAAKFFSISIPKSGSDIEPVVILLRASSRHPSWSAPTR
jgi:hypothetical protein